MWRLCHRPPGAAGLLTMALVAVAVIAILMEDLWIVLAAVAFVAVVAFALASVLNGNSWWN
jgi:hypothetical protein